ncbi:hypothetical protein NQ315_001201 [Exocentrus adspersus]|uniref:Uncharacterized protein n=1 Tax=Exocentrus adspersus TaxID=1586481 RepID=A0AAV8WE94_9CUCU|nr:hypothetical protein NQ315_001201 [Exocentrus adspersus]
MQLRYALITIFGVCTALPPNDEDYGVLGPPTFFEKPFYKAKVVNNALEVLDGPIILQNCHLYNYYIKVSADNEKYYTVPNPVAGCNSNCSVCLSAFVKAEVDPEEVLYDTITLEAHLEFYGTTTTTIMIVYSSEYDPYKLVYNINGTEYVILNYFYFKLFLFVIIASGVLLLVLEVKEIILKHRSREYAPIREIYYI